MTNPSAFVTHGIAHTQRALSAVAVMTNAHLNPSTLKRTLAQRARLEIIIRRLLVLMALGDLKGVHLQSGRVGDIDTRVSH